MTDSKRRLIVAKGPRDALRGIVNSAFHFALSCQNLLQLATRGPKLLGNANGELMERAIGELMRPLLAVPN